MTEPRATMTVRMAAEVMGVHENTIRSWIKQDLIEAYTSPRGSFRRPYADSVMQHFREGDIDTLRRLMVGKADRLEQQAAALRRAIAELKQLDRPPTLET